jgi:rhodanese-related sulfurtransferase
VVAGLLLLGPATPASAHTDWTSEQVHDRLLLGGDVVLVDVREYSEFCSTTDHIPDALNLPWTGGVFGNRLAELPPDFDIIVQCASGGRSNAAADYLDTQGYAHVYDMLGGIMNWPYQREACSPEPVLYLAKDPLGTWMNWVPMEGTQDYDLVRGLLGNVSDAGTFTDLGPLECLVDDSAYTYTLDLDPLTPGEVFIFLVRRADGSLGQSSNGLERLGDLPVECE